MLGFLRIPPPTSARATRALLAVTGPPPAEGEVLVLRLPEIDRADTFDAISQPASDLVNNGRLCKFLIDLRETDAPTVHFINGNFRVDGDTPDAARYHFSFAQAVLGIPEELPEFNAVTYFTEQKRYVAGVLHTYLLDDSGPLDGSTKPVYGIQFYPQDVIRERGVLSAVELVRAKLTIPDASVAFVPTGTQQTTATVVDDLTALGIDVLTLDRILGTINYIPLNVGEAWGHLRIFPEDNDDLVPTDIPVFEELPLDLSVVAGVITRAVQDTNSHVNLKSKERNTPNMVLRDAGPANAQLAAFADKPIHLVVAPSGFTLEPSSDEEVASKLAERLDKPLITVPWDPETRLLSYAEMARGSGTTTLARARKYGSKATNLGFLTRKDTLGRTTHAESPSAKHGYDLVPAGFGVPLQFYRNLIEYEPNNALRQALDTLIEAEQEGSVSNRERIEMVEVVQTAFLTARFPPDDLAAIKSKLARTLRGVNKIKVRSSANVEDIPNFDGAGLHDSFAATVSKKDNDNEFCQFDDDDSEGGEVKRKVKPRSVACAIKGVYASLWNKRAIEERNYARIDHSSVAMGLAIVGAYDEEFDITANAVLITRVINTQDVYGYSLSLQEGNNLVTNPDPGTFSEVTIAGFISDVEPVSITVQRFAKPTATASVRDTLVLDRAQMLDLIEIGKVVERAYCAAKRAYYGRNCAGVTFDNLKPNSLDMEFKFLSNGQLVCKQMREFGGR